MLVFGKAPSWVDEGVRDYSKRIPNLSLERIAGSPAKTRMRRMSVACGNRAVRVYLDKSGKSFTSESLARQCVSWERQGDDVCLLIGDDVGFSKADLAQADLVWSLSTLTLPHQLTRILVCEQLYRARSINLGHAYHRS
ncbi:MAG: 23S rRNA (pseudouridine(1915)-N(3))-methyltransferase RlmH [Gammaproteobacteria bacterium]|nr:23S rRNA (pseudouridine(1915)-N(3))-methyltransferase RlmH [Gammaproteobacteria bacterium]